MDSDEILFQRVRDGDLAAFDTLYARHEGRLFAYVRAVVGDRRDAEEVLHDAFMNTLKGMTDRLEAGAFRALLYRVARNLAFNRRRDTGRYARATKEVSREADTTVARAAPADRAIEARELDRALGAAVVRLPQSLGELYHLRSSGLSYEEIAGIVDAPVGTVKSRMHQMVSALREELKPWIAPE